MLQTAKSLGDRLVIVLSSDSHNRKPYAVAAEVRLRWLEELGRADKVIVGREDSFVETLRKEKPDIIALGYDQRLPDAATQKVVMEMGIEVVVLPWFAGKDEILRSWKP